MTSSSVSVSVPHLPCFICDSESASAIIHNDSAIGARDDELIVHAGFASGGECGMRADVAILAGPCRPQLHRSPGDQLELQACVVIRGHLHRPPILVLQKHVPPRFLCRSCKCIGTESATFDLRSGTYQCTDAGLYVCVEAAIGISSCSLFISAILISRTSRMLIADAHADSSVTYCQNRSGAERPERGGLRCHTGSSFTSVFRFADTSSISASSKNLHGYRSCSALHVSAFHSPVGAMRGRHERPTEYLMWSWATPCSITY